MKIEQEGYEFLSNLAYFYSGGQEIASVIFQSGGFKLQKDS